MNPTRSAAPPPLSPQAFVEIRQVRKAFGTAVAVDDVSVKIQRNEMFALLGSSGCGKSTLLRMLAGFETPSAGQIFIDGEDIAQMPPYLRPVNMMFQSYALFPHMDVEANIAYGLKRDPIPRSEMRDRVEEMLALVQLAPYRRRKPHQLSGGQQQRVALARSLIKRPKLLLLDEPMSALDKQIRQKTQMELLKTLQDVNVTCIMVTHDQEEAMSMANRIAVMDSGRILQVGSPNEIYRHPNCRFTAQFVGVTNLFEGRIVVDEVDCVEVQSPDLQSNLYINHGVTGPLGMEVAVSVRPECVSISALEPRERRNRATGLITAFSYLGSHALCQVKIATGRTLLADVATQGSHDAGLPRVGDVVWLSWADDQGVVLTA